MNITQRGSTSTRAPSAAFIVASAAYNAGFRGLALIIATAITGRESDWGTDIAPHTDTNGATAVGAWQINNGVTMPASQAAQLENTQNNAYAAYQKYQSDGFAPWALNAAGAPIYFGYRDTSGQWHPLNYSITQYLATARQAVAQGNAGGFLSPAEVSADSGGGSLDPSLNSAGGKGTLTQSNGPDAAKCLISMPSLAGLGGGCLFSRSQGKAVLGGLSMLGGGVLILGGLLIIGRGAVAGAANTAVGLAGPGGAAAKLAAGKASRASSGARTATARSTAAQAPARAESQTAVGQARAQIAKEKANQERARSRVSRAGARRSETEERENRTRSSARTQVAVDRATLSQRRVMSSTNPGRSMSGATGSGRAQRRAGAAGRSSSASTGSDPF